MVGGKKPSISAGEGGHHNRSGRARAPPLRSRSTPLNLRRTQKRSGLGCRPHPPRALGLPRDGFSRSGTLVGRLRGCFLTESGESVGLMQACCRFWRAGPANRLPACDGSRVAGRRCTDWYPVLSGAAQLVYTGRHSKQYTFESRIYTLPNCRSQPFRQPTDKTPPAPRPTTNPTTNEQTITACKNHTRTRSCYSLSSAMPSFFPMLSTTSPTRAASARGSSRPPPQTAGAAPAPPRSPPRQARPPRSPPPPAPA